MTEGNAGVTSYTIQSGLKTAAGCTARLVGRILGYTAIGLIINAIFIILLTPEISRLFSSAAAASERHVAAPLEGIWFGLVWAGTNALPLGLYVLFAVVFTVGYFLIGKKQGVASALNYAFNSNKAFLVANTLDRFLEHLDKRVDLSKPEILSDLDRLFDEYRKRMKNQPLALRWASKAFLDRFELTPAVLEVMRETGNKNLGSREYIVELATQVSDKIDVELFKPSILPLLVLLAVNLSVGIALKLFL